ncbi:MAG: phasin family protein [Methylococcaceae bacterium]|nr:phasin family protein [Methylococcaceae bacterium]MCI0733801.1 phasin family protein [Methylococcaceae bacterium]
MKTFQETITEVNELVTDSFKQLSEVNTRAYDSIVKGQTEIATLCVRTGVKQLELARDAKDVPAFLKAQKELTTEFAEDLIKYAQSAVELATSSRDDLFGLIESSVKGVAKIYPMPETKAA